MKNILLWAALICIALSVAVSQAPEKSSGSPQYTSGNELLKPGDYREWIFLSSGLGMNYGPAVGDHDMFTNVFVPQWAYREFLKSGKWPDKTVFVVEERGAESKGSINHHGHFQTDSTMGIGVEVKDEKRFPGQVGVFQFWR
jgi:cytochrome P460